MTTTITLPPFPPNSVGEKAAFAAYAVLRANDLIRAGDWTIPHEIGAEAQAMWERAGGTIITVPFNPQPKDPSEPGVWIIPLQNGPIVTCAKCGMRWEGAMGYVCPDNHCPVQPKVTC